MGGRLARSTEERSVTARERLPLACHRHRGIEDRLLPQRAGVPRRKSGRKQASWEVERELEWIGLAWRQGIALQIQAGRLLV